jgi:hypothetical protein
MSNLKLRQISTGKIWGATITENGCLDLTQYPDRPGIPLCYRVFTDTEDQWEIIQADQDQIQKLRAAGYTNLKDSRFEGSFEVTTPALNLVTKLNDIKKTFKPWP